MQVSNRMTKNPVTISPDTPVSEARDKMKKESIHRLPVIDKNDHLIGIITEKDILYASPSPATSLDVYEIHNLMSKLKVHSVMTKDVITIGPDTPLEDAARILADNNIGGLPIIENGLLIGIITESDLFRVFVELFGAREKGIRLTALMPEKRGELADLATAIAKAGGDIVSFGNMLGENATNRYAIIKVKNLSEKEVISAVQPLIERIVDVREI
ncbi:MULTISPECIES: CBS domain-containing protein [unclassified Oceanispirochaeta]|uniref:CBS domain-containing protein n=1 Tax=unclassified Oceanispirochaeta TaxID=2635722 RepID=UPI000E096CA1|nr:MULTISPECIES: CBS domain-containing protein [unclassified Oceanispirochaeta]MBF9017857.1 CBS domain-containing protein [Oceanispirochaeta sp. M2]NPD74368.1 CBS domain-containing protein [Oceanispirochaeta sp. M1]RDG29755.1 CBS domain-containing protein [Oceanispirochaeta sp. M1]